MLSSIANTCFYGGALRDGISAADRPPLPLPGLGRLSYGGGGGGGGGPAEVAVGAVRLPPLVFVDTGSQGGGAQHDAATRSSFNAGEVRSGAECAWNLRVLRLGQPLPMSTANPHPR